MRRGPRGRPTGHRSEAPRRREGPSSLAKWGARWWIELDAVERAGDGLSFVRRGMPRPTDGDVTAYGTNPEDWMQREGHEPVPSWCVLAEGFAMNTDGSAPSDSVRCDTWSARVREIVAAAVPVVDREARADGFLSGRSAPLAEGSTFDAKLCVTGSSSPYGAVVAVQLGAEKVFVLALRPGVLPKRFCGVCAACSAPSG